MNKNHPYSLPPPDWSATRAIYKKLSDEFHVLTDAFVVSIDDRSKLMLDHLILAIDEVDAVIDPLPEKSDRVSITQSILDFLMDERLEWSHPIATKTLQRRIKTLKQIVKELSIEKRFHRAAKNIFDFTEAKRHTTDLPTLIKYITDEGEATAELPLSVIKVDRDTPFGQFFSRLCRLMGIADLVIDAKSDYRSNFIAYKPTFNLYYRLNLMMVKEGVKLIWSFPNKWSFLVYCIRFTTLLIFSKD